MGKVRIIPPMIDRSLFRPGVSVDGMVATVGRLVPDKGHAAAIGAVASLPWAFLHIVGDGPERDTLRALAGPLGRRVTMHGAVPNSTVARLLSRSQFFVLASTYDQAPKALWEAMACGCTCIVSARVGLIEDGETGYQCDPTATGIAATLRRARQDRRREAVAFLGWIRSHGEPLGEERAIIMEADYGHCDSDR